jgi:hypothetical protein
VVRLVTENQAGSFTATHSPRRTHFSPKKKIGEHGKAAGHTSSGSALRLSLETKNTPGDFHVVVFSVWPHARACIYPAWVLGLFGGTLLLDTTCAIAGLLSCGAIDYYFTTIVGFFSCISYLRFNFEFGTKTKRREEEEKICFQEREKRREHTFLAIQRKFIWLSFFGFHPLSLDRGCRREIGFSYISFLKRGKRERKGFLVVQVMLTMSLLTLLGLQFGVPST